MNSLPFDILQIIWKDNPFVRMLSNEIRMLLYIDYSNLVLNYYDTTDSLNVNVAKLEYVNTTKTYNHLRLLSLYPKVIRFLDIKTNKLSICLNENCHYEKCVMKRKLPPLKELYITDNVRDHTFIIDKNTKIVKIALVSENDIIPKSLIDLQSINDSYIVSFELIFCNSKYLDKYYTKQWLSFLDMVNVTDKKVVYELKNEKVSLFKSIFVPKKIISSVYYEKENFISINKRDTNIFIDLTSFPFGVDKIKIILLKNACTMYAQIGDMQYIVEKFQKLEVLDLSNFKFNYLEIVCNNKLLLSKILLKTSDELLNVVINNNVSVCFINKVKIHNLHLTNEYSIINGDYVILNLFCQVTYNTKNINYILKYIISCNNYN